MIDREQADGRKSMICANEGCDFHDSGIVRPLVPTSMPIKAEDAPSWENYGTAGD